MSSTDIQSTIATSETYTAVAELATVFSAAAKVYFEQNSVPDGPERQSLLSEALALVLQKFSPGAPKSPETPNSAEALKSICDGEPPSATAEALPTTSAQNIDVPAATASSVPEAGSSAPSVSRPKSARLIAAREAAVANADKSATIVVTASATGQGIHTRWSYPDGSVDPAPTLNATEEALVTPSAADPGPPVETGFSDDSATLLGSSDDEHVAEREGNEAKGSDLASPEGKPVIIIKPASKKRPREVDPSIEEAGSSRRTRSKVSNPLVGNGVRHHHVPRESNAPSPPSSTSRLPPSLPFNHFPKLPRSRPQGLRREPAFYHKSHYDVAWVPEFGDYNQPPKTAAEALPEWFKPGTFPSATKAPTPVPSPSRPASNKRARDDKDETEVNDKGEKRLRRSPRHK